MLSLICEINFSLVASSVPTGLKFSAALAKAAYLMFANLSYSKTLNDPSLSTNVAEES